MRRIVSLSVMLGFALSVFPARAGEPGAQAAAVPEKVDTKIHMAPILVGSMGAVIFAVGAGFGWTAYEERDDFGKAPTKKLADDGEAHQIVADILLFGGGVVVIGSAIWWFVSLSDEPSPTASSKPALSKPTPSRVQPVIGLGQAGVAIEF